MHDTHSPSLNTYGENTSIYAPEANESSRFRSTVARIRNSKDGGALLDSGGAHNFFHSRSSFTNYKPLHSETDILFSDTFKPYKRCFLLDHRTHDLLFQTERINGLCKIPAR